MNHQALKEEIQTLIAANKIEDAIERLASAQFSALDKELIILNSQYNRVKEEIRLNLISKDEGERRMNGITMALINLSDKIGAEPSRLSKLVPEKKPGMGRLALLLIPALLVVGLVIWKMATSSDAQTGNPEGSPDDSTITTESKDSGNTVPNSGVPADDIVKTPEPELPAPTSNVDLSSLPKSLVAAFLFNGNANDAIGDHHGSMHGVVSADGWNGAKNSAYYFNGDNAHIKLPRILDVSTTNFSIACWLKSETENGSIFGQFSNKTDNYAYAATNHYVALVAGYPNLDEYPPTGGGFRSTKRIPLNQWVHIVFIRNGDKATLYINGEKAHEADMTEKYELKNNIPDYAAIGVRPFWTYGTGTYKENASFKGAIDDLYIFNAAIGPETVQQLYLKK